jgi:hypothetical protein
LEHANPIAGKVQGLDHLVLRPGPGRSDEVERGAYLLTQMAKLDEALRVQVRVVNKDCWGTPQPHRVCHVDKVVAGQEQAASFQRHLAQQEGLARTGGSRQQQIPTSSTQPFEVFLPADETVS